MVAQSLDPNGYLQQDIVQGSIQSTTLSFYFAEFDVNSLYSSEHGIIRSEEIRVRVGSSDHSGGGTIHKVKRIISHEKFNVASTLDYDFCLLELEHRITFNENAQPIELVNKYREIRDDTMCLVTGWGLTQSPNESRRFLRGVEVPIMNYQKCVFNYRRIQAVTPRMICAGYEKGEKDACTSESESINRKPLF